MYGSSFFRDAAVAGGAVRNAVTAYLTDHFPIYADFDVGRLFAAASDDDDRQ